MIQYFSTVEEQLLQSCPKVLPPSHNLRASLGPCKMWKGRLAQPPKRLCTLVKVAPSRQAQLTLLRRAKSSALSLFRLSAFDQKSKRKGKPEEEKWLWVKNRYTKWSPSKWKHRPKPAVPWWFNLTHDQIPTTASTYQ